MLGAVVRLSPGRLRKDAVLFGESQSRVVLSADRSQRQAILDQAAKSDVPASVIGTVSGDRLVIAVGDEGASPLIDIPVARLHHHWAFSLERALSQE